MAPDNRTLGRFDLVGIPPAQRGIPQIEVAFDIDANGIVHVSAKDLGTGKEQKIRIESSSGLSKDEIEKMQKDAEIHAAEDKKKKELIEARNQLDTLIYSIEKSLKDYGNKITDSEKKKIEEAKEKAKKSLTSEDINQIKKTQEELAKASHKLAEHVYQDAMKKQQAQQSKQAPHGTRPTGQGAEKKKENEDVVDADYKVEDEDKEKDK